MENVLKYSKLHWKHGANQDKVDFYSSTHSSMSSMSSKEFLRILHFSWNNNLGVVPGGSLKRDFSGFLTRHSAQSLLWTLMDVGA